MFGIGQRLEPNMLIGNKVLTNSNGDVDITSAGYQFLVDTLTQIRAEVVKQKFYKVPFGDFVPVVVGEGSGMETITQTISYSNSGDFFEGDKNAGPTGSGIAMTDVALSNIDMPIISWAKQADWDILDIRKAAAASNWNLIVAKMEALKENWDLGVQRLAFLGHPKRAELTGLLNNPEVTVDTTLIPVPVKDMTKTQFQAFVGGLMGAYIKNSNYTENSPDMLVMPTDDFFGLVNAASEDFPTISKIEYLKNALATATGNRGFEIKPLAYAQKENNKLDGAGKNRYVLYKKDVKTMKMAIPTDFTLLEAGTANNYHWVQPAHGQYSGLLINRKPEVLYFDRV